MKTMRSLVLVAMGVILGSSGPIRAGDEPEVDLRGPAVKVGQVFRKTSKFKVTDADLTVQFDDKKGSGKMTLTGVSEEEVKILALTGGKVSKFQTKHIQDDTKTVTTMGGETTTDDDVDDLAGEVVLSEKRDGKWTHALIDSKPTEKQQKAFGSLEGWDDEDQIPEGKQALGRSWEVDATHMKKYLSGNYRSVSGKMKSTFVRLEKYRGELCAVIETAGPMKAKVMIDNTEALVDFDLKLVEYRSLRLGHVIKSTVDGTIRIVFKKKFGELEAAIEAKGKISGEETKELKE